MLDLPSALFLLLFHVCLALANPLLPPARLSHDLTPPLNVTTQNRLGLECYHFTNPRDTVHNPYINCGPLVEALLTNLPNDERTWINSNHFWRTPNYECGIVWGPVDEAIDSHARITGRELHAAGMLLRQECWGRWQATEEHGGGYGGLVNLPSRGGRSQLAYKSRVIHT